MPTIFLTGGSGYIGTHTCLTLLNAGFNVIVIDSNINSNPLSIKKILEMLTLVIQEFLLLTKA